MEKMDKRTLSAIPRPEVTPELIQAFRKSYKKTGMVTASRMETGGKDTLIVNVFHKDVNKILIPYFRVFCQLDGDITQDLVTDKIKWKTAMFATVIGGYYSPGYGRSGTDYDMASAEDMIAVKEFVETYMKERGRIEIPGKEFHDYLNAYQYDLRDRHRIEKHKTKLAVIDRQMDLFGPLPEDYQQFVEDTVLGEDQFMFYSRKHNRAYCTKCRQEIILEGTDDNNLFISWDPGRGLKHNADIQCPCCGEMVMAKSEGYSRKNMRFVNWSVLVQASGDSVLVRYLRSIKDFREDFRNPEYSTVELYRTIHTPKNQFDFEVGYYQPTGEYRWRPPVRHMYWFGTSYNTPMSRTVIYNKDWTFLKTTCMRYSCIDQVIKNVNPDMGPWGVDNWFHFYHQYPFVEQLIKIGWFALVRELKDDHGNEINNLHCERSVCKILGITKSQFRYLRESTGNNPKLIDLAIMRYANEKGIRITPEDHSALRRICFRAEARLHEHIIDLAEYGSIHRIIRWMGKQDRMAIHDYFQYIRWAEELHYNLKDEQILLPANFRQKHDELSAQYTAMKDRLKQEEKARFNRVLAQLKDMIIEGDPLNMHAAGLIIRRPYELEELKIEGEVLHHCVGTYIERVMEGQTQIFFIRKEAEPDKPFYTMEWNNHHMIQCRGNRNCAMTPEVKAFTEVFSEKMVAFENGLKKQTVRQRIKAVV